MIGKDAKKSNKKVAKVTEISAPDWKKMTSWKRLSQTLDLLWKEGKIKEWIQTIFSFIFRNSFYKTKQEEIEKSIATVNPEIKQKIDEIIGDALYQCIVRYSSRIALQGARLLTLEAKRKALLKKSFEEDRSHEGDKNDANATLISCSEDNKSIKDEIKTINDSAFPTLKDIADKELTRFIVRIDEIDLSNAYGVTKRFVQEGRKELEKWKEEFAKLENIEEVNDLGLKMFGKVDERAEKKDGKETKETKGAQAAPAMVSKQQGDSKLVS